MNSWLVYFILSLNSFKLMLGLVTAFFGICIIAGCIAYLYGLDGELTYDGGTPITDVGKALVRKFLAPFIIISLIFCLCPTTKQITVIYLLPKIANNEHVQKIPTQALTVLSTKLTSWIEETIHDVSHDLAE